MSREIFDSFKEFITTNEFSKDRVVKSFNTLEYLSVKVTDEIIYIKPTIETYQYNAHLEGLIHSLNKLGYPSELDFDKINDCLKLLPTSLDSIHNWEEFVHEYKSSNHFLTLDTELLPEDNITDSDELKYKRIKGSVHLIRKSHLELLQKVFDDFIKQFYVKQIRDYINTELSLNMERNERFKSEPFPPLFKDLNSYQSFLKYRDDHVIEPFVDYSYLFQRLKHEKLISKISHTDFTIWLSDNDLITDKTKDDFLREGQFRSLQKSYSIQRDHNFNRLFNNIETD